MEGTRDGGENKEMRCKQKGVQIGNKGEWDNGKRTMGWKPCPDGGRDGNWRRKLGGRWKLCWKCQIRTVRNKSDYQLHFPIPSLCPSLHSIRPAEVLAAEVDVKIK